MRLRSGEFAKCAAMRYDNLSSSWETPASLRELAEETPASYRELLRELADDTTLGRLAKLFPGAGTVVGGMGGVAAGTAAGPFVEPVADLAGRAIGGVPGTALRVAGHRQAVPALLGAAGAAGGNLAGKGSESAVRTFATRPWAAAHVGVDKIVDLLNSLRGR